MVLCVLLDVSHKISCNIIKYQIKANVTEIGNNKIQPFGLLFIYGPYCIFYQLQKQNRTSKIILPFRRLARRFKTKQDTKPAFIKMSTAAVIDT